MSTATPKTVLVLCTGNSCRSQMAEGLINARMGEHFRAFSAGTHPGGYVHPAAIRAMADIGIDLSEHHSKSVDKFRTYDFDFVITVCADADEDCPVWLNPTGERVHIGFEDPAKATGTPAEILSAFRSVRDQIADRVLGYLAAQLPAEKTEPTKKQEYAMTASTIRAEFEQDLDKLNDSLLRLSSMVNNAIKLAMQALEQRDEKLARQVIADDTRINQLRYKIEGDCLSMIAKQQPVAGDLRFIIAAMTIAPDLERMGDHAAGIAKIAVEMGNHPPLKPLIDLPQMAAIAQDMLTRGMHAFNTGDDELARTTIEMDDEVDALYTRIFRELLTFMIDDPETITRAMYLLFVGHNLERIADRVTNICERVLFRVSGIIEETPSSADVISIA